MDHRYVQNPGTSLLGKEDVQILITCWTGRDAGRGGSGKAGVGYVVCSRGSTKQRLLYL